MEILEIDLENPINFDEFETIKTQVEQSLHYNFLLIDFGKHEFNSICVMKHFRGKLESLKPSLMQFKKIAFIHPEQFMNQSDNPEIFEYFTSKKSALKWFLSGK